MLLPPAPPALGSSRSTDIIVFEVRHPSISSQLLTTTTNYHLRRSLPPSLPPSFTLIFRIPEVQVPLFPPPPQQRASPPRPRLFLHLASWTVICRRTFPPFRSRQSVLPLAKSWQVAIAHVTHPAQTIKCNHQPLPFRTAGVARRLNPVSSEYSASAPHLLSLMSPTQPCPSPPRLPSVP